MNEPDLIKLETVQYDSKTERALIRFAGWQKGQPVSFHGSFCVETPGDQTQSQVRAAIKAEAANLLRDLSKLLEDTPGG